MENEQDKLVKRFTALESQGLVDVKFLLRNAGEATSEQVYREVNAFMEADENGDSLPFSFKDSTRM